VPLLEKRLADQKIAATVVNASISGDTTSGGRSRLAALLKQHQPTHVVLELGGNDALRGLPIQNTEDNLTQMTKAAQAGRRQGAARRHAGAAARAEEAARLALSRSLSSFLRFLASSFWRFSYP
jgi:lysophospholipase L1-like esterase